MIRNYLLILAASACLIGAVFCIWFFNVHAGTQHYDNDGVGKTLVLPGILLFSSLLFFTLLLCDRNSDKPKRQ